jgi:hypothetical protein
MTDQNAMQSSLKYIDIIVPTALLLLAFILPLSANIPTTFVVSHLMILAIHVFSLVTIFYVIRGIWISSEEQSVMTYAMCVISAFGQWSIFVLRKLAESLIYINADPSKLIKLTNAYKISTGLSKLGNALDLFGLIPAIEVLVMSAVSIAVLYGISNHVLKHTKPLSSGKDLMICIFSAILIATDVLNFPLHTRYLSSIMDGYTYHDAVKIKRNLTDTEEPGVKIKITKLQSNAFNGLHALANHIIEIKTSIKQS